MAPQRPHLAAVPSPVSAPLLNRNCSPERIAELRARLEAADNARPRPALRPDGPESLQVGARSFTSYDLLDMAPLALRGGVAVEGRRRDG